jgi:hypothetical protein
VRAYGEVNPALTASITGFKLGQDASVLDTGPTLGTPATQASDVGAYAITAGGAADTNYAFAYEEGQLDITQALLTVTADDKVREYGEANPALTASITGFKLGQDAGVIDTGPTLGTPATAASDVGLYAITAGGAADGNYAFAYADGQLEIDKATLEVTLIDPTPARAQGQANPVFDLSYSGFKLNQTVANLENQGRAETQAAPTSPTGVYPIWFSGGYDSNYAFAFARPLGTLLVTGAALPPTVENARDYGSMDRTNVLDIQQSLLPVTFDMTTEDQHELARRRAER